MAGVQALPTAPKPQTLNERLNRALDRIETEADRIERCLRRVEGTPDSAEKGLPVSSTTKNLVYVVEAFESQAERLRQLSERVDQIA